ncbi:hypothetical protein [Staphylococcus equorum]|uniref:Uncharacterized protein n=1 Tax=Staphylococcus equorum TaxID=246432 RepID=A0A9X4LCZ4_9STAP|nr:hypothetical protein [Staphylococcus equorum]MDG0860312.1 hypothetical protein [Staphylococcus equorum]
MELYIYDQLKDLKFILAEMKIEYETNNHKSKNYSYQNRIRFQNIELIFFGYVLKNKVRYIEMWKDKDVKRFREVYEVIDYLEINGFLNIEITNN